MEPRRTLLRVRRPNQASIIRNEAGHIEECLRMILE
jgi:hypothetical protein